MVNVIDPPVEVVEWPNLLNSLDCFSSISNTNEDFNKLSQYKAKVKFEEKIKVSSDYNSVLKEIKMVPEILEINDSTLSRAVQLSQKTNQMNISLIRYNEKSMKNIVNDNSYFSFLISLKDKFGDHGIISLVIIKKCNNKSAF